VYISRTWGGGKPLGRKPSFFLEEDIRDEIRYFKFGDDRFRGLASAEGQILLFPIDFDVCPYNTLTLPCERVIYRRSLRIAGVFSGLGYGMMPDKFYCDHTLVAMSTKFGTTWTITRLI